MFMKNIPQDLIEKITCLYYKYKYILAYVEIGGSACNNFIKNPRDIDVAFTYWNMKRDIPDIKELTSDWNNLKKEYPDLNYLGRDYVIKKKQFINNYIPTAEDNAITTIKTMFPIYSYTIKDIIFIGELDSYPGTDVDVLGKDKDRFIESICQSTKRMVTKYEEGHYLIKGAYHLLTGIYLIERNSYDLSEEEIDNINILHDLKDMGKCIELYNIIVDWVTAHNK